MVSICGTHVYLQMFFSFIQNFDFLGAVRGEEGQKSQNDINFCPSHSISQEPSLLVHKCKMIISPGIFFIVSTNFFSRIVRGSNCKQRLKMIKNSVRAPYILGAICAPYFLQRRSYQNDCEIFAQQKNVFLIILENNNVYICIYIV